MPQIEPLTNYLNRSRLPKEMRRTGVQLCEVFQPR